jgi:acyl-CoA thioester hydrolase
MNDFTFPVSTSIRLDWSEMDMFGHINNVMYFKYLQASRIAYWERIGMDRLFPEQRIGPSLAATRCDFRRPLHYPAVITVQVSIEFIRNTSFGLYHRVLDENGELAAEGHDVIVLFDYNRQEKVRFPDSLRRQVEELEGRPYPAATDS